MPHKKTYEDYTGTVVMNFPSAEAYVATSLVGFSDRETLLAWKFDLSNHHPGLSWSGCANSSFLILRHRTNAWVPVRVPLSDFRTLWLNGPYRRCASEVGVLGSDVLGHVDVQEKSSCCHGLCPRHFPFFSTALVMMFHVSYPFMSLQFS